MQVSKIYNFWLTQMLLISAVAVALGYVIAKVDVAGAGALLVLPFLILYLVLVFKNPRIGFFTVLHMGFFLNGLSRYSAAPFGLGIDVVLLITLIATFVNGGYKRYYRYLKNPIIYGAIIWTAFTFFEIINPESRNFLAWFYAVRGVSLYMIQVMILTVLLMNDPKDVMLFLKIWIVWSVIAGVYAMKQIYLGVNHAEQVWLDEGAYKTHILFGKLRAFSFYSDAGQFGAAMGHIMLITLIMCFGPFARKTKLILWGLTALFFWCMAISGTRGAYFVPISGIMVYLFLTKNFKILMVGVLIMGVFYGLLKFTTVGSGNYQIQRMRSAMDPNDPSLQVRLANQRKFSDYLAHRPLGGGIGSAGSWGQRFSPGTFLAETPTDSWYVKIWAETGIIGLYVHIGIILMFALSGVVFIFRMKGDLKLKQIAMALLAGFVGVAFASYGNQVLGQAPSSITVFMSLSFVWLIYRWDKRVKEKAPDLILIENE
jgi:hypothetical protein